MASQKPPVALVRRVTLIFSATGALGASDAAAVGAALGAALGAADDPLDEQAPIRALAASTVAMRGSLPVFVMFPLHVTAPRAHALGCRRTELQHAARGTWRSC